MTKDISLGLDPKLNINLANNPVSNAVNSAERWASAKVDRWIGRPAELPAPGLILPGQAVPNPGARLIVPGQAVPNPDAKIIIPGAGAGSGLDKEVKIWLPGRVTVNPGAKIIIPGEAVPNPDAQIILPGQ